MILVQREFHVATKDQAEFERQSREGLWPTFQLFGAQMVGFGRWGFGGQGGVVVTNTAYADFEHWLATRAPVGDFYKDAEMLEEAKDLLPIFAHRSDLITKTEAHLFEIIDDISEPAPFYRKPGSDLQAVPLTFGRGSVLAIRRYTLVAGGFGDFIDVARNEIWPQLKEQGARPLAIGRDLMAGPNTATVFTAFASLPAFYADSTNGVGRSDVQEDLVVSEAAQLLMIGTDYGQKV